MILRVKRLSPHARLPEYKSEGASGLDLYAAQALTLAPGEYGAISTGIAIELPKGFEAQIRPRSGLALKYGVGVLNSPGTIDSDYRGEIKIILFNLGSHRFKVRRGMRIAQLVLTRVTKVKVVECELSPTTRQAKGFGSTGI